MRKFMKARGRGIILSGLLLCLQPAASAQEPLPPKPLAPPPNPTPVNQAATRPSSPAGPLSVTDVVAMHQSGLGDAVIIESIHQNRIASRLGAAELISMRRHGISNEVIQAMQQRAPLPEPRPAAPRSTQTTYVRQPTYVTRPLVVEPIVEPILVAPPLYRPYCPPCFHHRHYYYRRPVSSFGIHIGF